MAKEPIPPYHLGPEAPTADQSREHDEMQRDAQYIEDSALSSHYDRSRTPLEPMRDMKHPVPYEYAPDSYMDIPTERQVENMREHAERIRARHGGVPDAPPDVPKPKY